MQDDRELLQDTFDRLEQIGSGGGGTVYKAHHKRLDKEVVLKKIHTKIVGSVEKRGELDILKNLKHPYLPQVFDFFEFENNVYTVMEFIPGKSFAEWLSEGRRFTQKEAVTWARQLCEVVHYLHSQKPPIVHCDIKPANIMLTPAGNICLIDFNISGAKSDAGMATIGYSDGYAPIEQFAVVSDRLVKSAEARRQTVTNNVIGYTGQPAADEVTEIADETTEVEGEVTEIADETTEVEDEVTEIADETAEAEGEVTEIADEASGNRLPEAERKAPAAVPERSLMKALTDENWKKAREMAASLGNHPAVDERTDIYSVGASLYHIVSGVKPKPFYLPYVPVEETGREISESFAYFINKAMALKPEGRFKDSGKLLKAIHNMGTFDKRYRSLVRKRTLTASAMALLTAASVLSIFGGKRQIEKEEREAYAECLAEMKTAMSEEDYEEVMGNYESAITILPQEQDAYYEMGMSFYERGKYEDCIDYLKENVFTNPAIIQNSAYGRFYDMNGSCYFELEDYDSAVFNYEKAVELQPDEVSYYRDYVVSLARKKDITEAENVLKQAVKKGISADVLSLLQGEIAFARGNYEEAEQGFLDCIEKTEDNYHVLRAYSKLDDVYREAYDGEEGYEKRIAILLKAKDVLSDAEGITLTEKLAQVYIDYAVWLEENGDTDGMKQYDGLAIELFRESEEKGYATFMNRYNIAVLYEKNGEYEAAKEQINAMLESYGDNYNLYKRLCFILLDIEDKKPGRERNYSEFQEAYDMALKLYQENAAGEDGEMLLLGQLYQDLITNGWLGR